MVEPRAPRAFAYGAVWASVPDPGLAPGTLLQRYVAARVMLGWLPVGRATPDGRREHRRGEAQVGAAQRLIDDVHRGSGADRERAAD